MSDDITSRLETFESQIEDGEYESAAETLDEIASAFAETERENSRVYVKSLAASGRVEDEEALTAYAESATTLDLQRSQFLLRAAIYLTAPDGFEESALRSEIETLAEAESTARERRTTTKRIADSAILPAQPAIIDVDGTRRLSVGETATLEVVTANVGDEATASATLTVNPADGLAVADEAHAIGSIPADSDRPVAVSVTAQAAGQHTLSLELAIDGTVVSTEGVTIGVLGESGTDSSTQSTGNGEEDGDDGTSGLLPIAGSAGLGALGGGAALYRYLSGESESDDADTNTETDD